MSDRIKGLTVWRQRIGDGLGWMLFLLFLALVLFVAGGVGVVAWALSGNAWIGLGVGAAVIPATYSLLLIFFFDR